MSEREMVSVPRDYLEALEAFHGAFRADDVLQVVLVRFGPPTHEAWVRWHLAQRFKHDARRIIEAQDGNAGR